MLLPLPMQHYEMARFKTVKVNIDYHVEIEAHRYSMPHALVGQELDARITGHAVELPHRGQRVACHARSERRGAFTTVPEHMPAAHRAHLEWTPQRLIDWGECIGMATGAIVTRPLSANKHPEHGYRACLSLLSLAKRYGEPRVEAACTVALSIGACCYRNVRDILANKRDQVAPGAAGDWVSPDHPDVRGAGYYQ